MLQDDTYPTVMSRANFYWRFGVARHTLDVAFDPRDTCPSSRLLLQEENEPHVNDGQQRYLFERLTRSLFMEMMLLASRKQNSACRLEGVLTSVHVFVAVGTLSTVCSKRAHGLAGLAGLVEIDAPEPHAVALAPVQENDATRM